MGNQQNQKDHHCSADLRGCFNHFSYRSTAKPFSKCAYSLACLFSFYPFCVLGKGQFGQRNILKEPLNNSHSGSGQNQEEEGVANSPLIPTTPGVFV
jgi:hypothetical protein